MPFLRNDIPTNRRTKMVIKSRVFMKKTILYLLLIILFLLPSSVLAQSYYFSLDKETVHVYWEADGSMDLIYEFVFTNQPE